MSELPVITDLASLFLNDVPLMDVRAPVEFAKGAFPMAVNRPILDDSQREQIGTRYKVQGQDAAIALGLKLATPEVRQARYEAWGDFIQQNPDGVLYCFRGGLRSRTTQQWIKEALGIEVPRVAGGYKAMRRLLIDTLEQEAQAKNMILISGHTGSGKTRLLEKVPNSVDLEEIARHRGSAFGARVGGQPGQIDFENQLAIAILKMRQRCPGQPLVLEDEGGFIGSVAIPLTFNQAMRSSPIVVLESSLEQRVEQSVADYVHHLHGEFRQHMGDAGDEAWSRYLREGLDRVRRRLGGERYQQFGELLEQALSAWLQRQDEGPFRHLLERFLVEYYDPMYAYQIAGKAPRIVFRGDEQAVQQYLAENSMNKG